jgi:DNA repair protein RadC
LTQRLVAAGARLGVDVLDHIIVGAGLPARDP